MQSIPKEIPPMIRRLSIYFREMYPLIPRFALGLIIFGEIHFIILLNAGIRTFHLGFQELIGSFTVFSFLLWLRIADDFKTAVFLPIVHFLLGVFIKKTLPFLSLF